MPGTPERRSGSQGAARSGSAGAARSGSAADPRMRIDHVTLAGPSLSDLQEGFRRSGLETEYGGAHSNGATHMALLGFDDGSYVELISLVRRGAVSPLWHRQIEQAGGAAAWAVVVEDLAGEVERLRALDVPVRGPVDYRRVRPDGAAVEWELAFPGDHPPGAVLPFLIRDRTPRDRRVRPSPSVAGSELEGVEAVVLAVRSAERAASIFRRCYGWGPVRTADDGDFGARLAHVPGTPVVLAEPLDPDGRLSRRIDRFGEAPCAFLIRTRDPAATARRLDPAPVASGDGVWFGRNLRWMHHPPGAPDVEAGGGSRAMPPFTLGFIE